MREGTFGRSLADADRAGAGRLALNERRVLTEIRSLGAAAKAEIARLTGLSAQTVSVIMRKLEADGLLLRGTPQRGRVGQPSVPMRLNPDGAFFLGLKIGRRRAELALMDFLGHIRARRMLRYDLPEPQAIIDFAHEARNALISEMDDPARLAGLGIAMPFELWNWAEAIGVPARAMSGWRQADLARALEQEFALPVYLQNDATAACHAELVFSETKMPANTLHVYIAYFVGGGLVLEGRMMRGPNGNAAALGPFMLGDGQQGELLDHASLATLERQLHRAGLGSDILWDNPDDWGGLPDALVSEWIDGAAEALAYLLRNALAILDLDCLMINGWMPPEIRARLTEATRQAFMRHSLVGIIPAEIRSGEIGPDARALGASSLPLQDRFLYAEPNQ